MWVAAGRSAVRSPNCASQAVSPVPPTPIVSLESGEPAAGPSEPQLSGLRFLVFPVSMLEEKGSCRLTPMKPTLLFSPPAARRRVGLMLTAAGEQGR